MNSNEERKVVEWLPPLPSRETHRAVSEARVDGVGDWLLRTEAFSTWRTQEGVGAKPVLFCYGDLGVGKTFISSLVIDTLCSEKGGDGWKDVSYVYCDFRAQDTQSVSAILGSVLKQAIGGMGQVRYELERELEREERRVEGYKLQLPEILEMLIMSISSRAEFYICIDAFDEFPVKKRAQLWDSLRRVVRECPKARLFLTGRAQIQGEVEKYFPGGADMVSVKPTMDDITSYIEHRLGEDLTPDAMSEELRRDVLRVILERLSGIFLLVALKMDALLGEVTTHKRRQVLDKMIDALDLSNAYEKTVDRIKQQGGSKGKLGIEALMWISCCERPLKSEELCYALGVELGKEDLDTRNIPPIQTVLYCTLGLVAIDETTSTVRLLHPTLQEYLGQHPTLFATAHSIMAETCLTYLNSRSVRALPSSMDPALAATTFLEYATCFWGAHASMEVTEPVKSLALRLLDGYENHVSAFVLWRKKIRKWYLPKGVRRISGLHCIAFWGISEIAIAMLETKRWDMDCRDSEGDTPLMWAVKYGNDRLAELLLEQGDIEPNVALRGSRPGFSPSTQWRNEGVVKLLLESGDINPNISDHNGRTPLSYAAMGGLEGVVKLLLERGDVIPDPPDINGRTPLSFAAEWAREELVRPFLERGDVDPNSSDRKGRSPLSLAAHRQHQGVLKLLSGYGNPDRKSLKANGRTTTTASGEDTQGQEAIEPSPELEAVTPRATDDPPVDPPISRPTSPGPPRERPSLSKQSPPDQSDSASAPSTATPILRSSLVSHSILLALILYLIFYEYVDSREIFRAISRVRL